MRTRSHGRDLPAALLAALLAASLPAACGGGGAGDEDGKTGPTGPLPDGAPCTYAWDGREPCALGTCQDFSNLQQYFCAAACTSDAGCAATARCTRTLTGERVCVRRCAENADCRVDGRATQELCVQTVDGGGVCWSPDHASAEMVLQAVLDIARVEFPDVQGYAPLSPWLLYPEWDTDIAAVLVNVGSIPCRLTLELTSQTPALTVLEQRTESSGPQLDPLQPGRRPGELGSWVRLQAKIRLAAGSPRGGEPFPLVIRATDPELGSVDLPLRLAAHVSGALVVPSHAEHCFDGDDPQTRVLGANFGLGGVVVTDFTASSDDPGFTPALAAQDRERWFQGDGATETPPTVLGTISHTIAPGTVLDHPVEVTITATDALGGTMTGTVTVAPPAPGTQCSY